MYILILDDSADRHAYYHEAFKGDEVVHCFRYRQFLDALPTRVWDLIFLDHDLGDHHTADTYRDGWGKEQEYNGAHASMRICDLPTDRYPKKVIVQSVNFDGKSSILANLKRVGIYAVWEPYGESYE